LTAVHVNRDRFVEREMFQRDDRRGDLGKAGGREPAIRVFGVEYRS
jgi:hypothetical protein